MLREVRFFFSECLSNFYSTGAIAPSSPWLAQAILRPLQQRPSSPVSILEAGPGTGSFTRAVFPLLQPGDRFDIYELNPRFYEHMTKMLLPEKFEDRGIECKIFNEDIRNLQSGCHYDYIISGLPLNNFDVQTVTEILQTLMDHLKSTGTFSYFEYIFLPKIKMQFLSPASRLEAMKVRATVKEFIDRHQIDCHQVWLNLPPASARHFQNPHQRAS